MKKMIYKTFGCISLSAVLVLGAVACGSKETVSNHKSADFKAVDDVEGEFNPKSKSALSKTQEIETYINYYYYFEKDSEKQEESYFDGIMAGLDDPYSVYYTKDEYAKLKEDDTGVYVGIGATVAKNVDTDEIYIVKPIKNSPAEKSGILPEDVIVKINDTVVTKDMELETAVDMIRGEENTSVDVTVKREGTKGEIVLHITRAKLENPTVSYEMLQGNIGYIEVTQFISNTPDQFKAALDDLSAQGAKAFVFDLRNNPGGLLTSVVSMLDYIIDDSVQADGGEKPGDILYTKDKNGKTIEKYGCSDKHSIDLPMVVLVNENSASASEVFTSCMRDYKKATIVGTTTFGKGIVQSIFPLSDGSAVKITIAKYFTPSGTEIHKIGITPDVEVELPDDLKKKITIPHKDDTQLQEAVKVLGGAPLTDE
ncbi:carboxyl-terminal processing protease [Eubacterium ruminantium]|nr:carboxyl-terminal processing protease [Eubacterium ruminantium]